MTLGTNPNTFSAISCAECGDEMAEVMLLILYDAENKAVGGEHGGLRSGFGFGEVEH